jgi:L-ascorbate metabolism protein UlaG (beta-lactamase superfamily)
MSAGRRVIHGGASGYVVFVRPPEHDPFEVLALHRGYLAVIEREVIQPHTPAAAAWKARIENPEVRA